MRQYTKLLSYLKIRAWLKYAPYQIVGGLSIMFAFFVGALLQGSADYIRAMKQAAYMQGQYDIMVNMPIESLTKMEIKEHEV